MENQAGSSPAKTKELARSNAFPVIHTFVALCDNVNQGIVPVPASLGNGDSAGTNLYWGAAFGVKTFFKKSKDWELVYEQQTLGPVILERCVFRHKRRNAFMVADAYRGKEIARAIRDFLQAAAGFPGDTLEISNQGEAIQLHAGGSAELVAYVGHNGLMDFSLDSAPQANDEKRRDAIILACASKSYFSKPLKLAGAEPLLWTTNLMAPEAYILAAAVDAWIKENTAEEVRQQAAKAYHQYQNCGLSAANRLFATGW